MKRLAILAVGLLFVGGLYACGDGETKPGAEVIIPNNDNGGGPTTDPGGTDETPRPDIDEPDNDPGTPDQDPGTGGDTDTTPDVPDNDPGSTDDGGGVPGCVDDPVGSCKAVFECLNDCPQGAAGEACAAQCEGNLSNEGRADYQAFISCLSTNCSNSTSNEQLNQCLEDFCMEQYYGCFWGCEYGECYDLVGCLSGCAKFSNEEAANECRGDCWGGATAEAQIDLSNAIKCTQQACPICAKQNATPQEEQQCDDCWEEAASTTCESEWDKCVRYGEGNCRTLWICVQNCGGNDRECVQACGAAASKEAIDLYDKVWDCILKDDHCPSTMPDDQWQTCANAALKEGGVCDEDLTNCIGEQVYGDGNCGDLWNCINNVNCDAQCANDCREAATKEANGLFDDIMDCIFEECEGKTGNELDTCANAAIKGEGACVSKVEACFGPATYGDKTCGETVQCMNGCGTNESCQRTCVNNATETGNGLLRDLFQCLETACPSTMEDSAWRTCMEQAQGENGACYADLQACINDNSAE